MKPHVNLAGDARSDSPGYSAKYITYSVIEMESKIVLDLNHVSEINNNSVAVEKLGLRRILERLDDNDITVSTLAMDRSTQIKGFMKKPFPPYNTPI